MHTKPVRDKHTYTTFTFLKMEFRGMWRGVNSVRTRQTNSHHNMNTRLHMQHARGR